MTGWPDIDFGHTPADAAMARGDVYGVTPMADRAGKRRLRVGIAGCGGVALAKWIPAIRRLQTIGEPLDIAGFADTSPGAADKAAALSGAPAYPSLAALIADGAPDLVLVLASDAAHVPLAEKAITAGIPCLVEKPLARSYSEAIALVREAAARGVLLATVANKRFSPPYAMAKALIESGALHAAPTVFTGKFTLGYAYVDLLEAGTVHLIDLMLWLMGPVAKVHARGIDGADGRLQSAVASFAFRSGAIGTLMTSAAGLSFKPWERVDIFGRNAFLVVDDQIETTLFDEETGPAKSWRPAIPNTLMFDESFGGYTGLLENVLDAIRGLASLGASGTDGAAAVAVIEAIRRALAGEREIDMATEGLA